MRRFAWGGTAPLLLLLLLPSLGYALALGNISVRSALNEPFEADIKLSSVSAGELDSAHIKLASRADFKRAGILQTPILSDLRFSVVKRGGKNTVLVSSVAPVRDPFLDFLVEVVTRKGRMVRQYTVLIDPPDLPAGFRPAPPVAAPQVAPRSTGTIRRVPVPRSTRIAVEQRGAGRAGGGTAGGTGSRRSSAVSASAGDTYGPTRRNDTLWDIARETRPSGSVSMNQMMMALLRNNPQAFRNNNVNNLKSGQTLAIPEQGEITQLSREQAKNAFQQQYHDWKAGVASAPPPKVERQVVSESLRADAARIKAPAAETDSGELVLVAPRDDEELAAPDTSGTGQDGSVAGGADVDAAASGPQGGSFDELRRQRDLAQEQAYTAAQESRELARRTDELEGRLAELERVLQLRDADIAAMQERAGEIVDAGTDGLITDEPPADDMVVAADQPADSGEEPGMDAGMDGESEALPGSEQADDGQPDVAVVPIEPASSPLDIITDNWERAAAVAGLLGVGGLGIFLTRRRRRDDDLSDFEESDIVEMPKVTSGDVITEVNQYLAYGRPQQAEERLKQAMIVEPERVELPVKLLEVYSRTGNKEAFDALAGEVYTRMGKNSVSADWQRIAGMGRRLSPNNPLYAPIGGNVAGMVAGTTPAAVITKPPAAKPVAASTAAAGLAATGAAAAGIAAQTAQPDIEDEGPAFDELEQELRRLEKEIGAAVAEEDTLGSDLDVADSSLDATPGAGNSSADDGMDFDLSFDDLDKLDSSGDAVAANAAGSADASDGGDDGSLDFDWGADDDQDSNSGDAGDVEAIDDIGADLSSAMDSDFSAPSDSDLVFDSVGSADKGPAEVVRGGPPQAEPDVGLDDSGDADIAMSFDDIAEMDTDLEVGSGFDANAEAGSASETDLDADLSADFGADLDFGSESPASATGSSESSDDILSFDDIPDDSDSLSFDDNGPTASTGADDGGQDFIDLGDFGSEDLETESAAGGGADMEELTTKLDLARAYVDMEDRDSAIDILDEVLNDASGVVRSEAEALRKQLG